MNGQKRLNALGFYNQIATCEQIDPTTGVENQFL